MLRRLVGHDQSVGDADRHRYDGGMKPVAEKLDIENRRQEKQDSRDADARALASGEKSREQLRRENGAFSGLNVEIDFDGAQSLS